MDRWPPLGYTRPTRKPRRLPVTLLLGPPSTGKCDILLQLAQQPECTAIGTHDCGVPLEGSTSPHTVQTLTVEALQQLAGAAANPKAAAVLAAGSTCNPWQVAAWFQDNCTDSCLYDLLESLTGEAAEDNHHDHEHEHASHGHGHSHVHSHSLQQQQQQQQQPASGSGSRRLVDVAALDAIVTVLEANTLLQQLSAGSTAVQLGWVADHHPAARSCIPLLLAAQIEAADLLVLAAADAVSPLLLPLLQQLLRGFNSRAEVLTLGAHDAVSSDQLLDRGLHDPSTACAGPTWVGALRQAASLAALHQQHQLQLQPLLSYCHPPGDATAAVAGADTLRSDSGCGSSPPAPGTAASWVFTAHLPFHPGRLHSWVTRHFSLTETGDLSDTTPQPQAVAAFRQQYGQVLTSKGVVWLLGRDATAGDWLQVGPVLQLQPGDPWTGAAAAGATEAPCAGQQQQQQPGANPNWAPGVGDRRQELVFIGFDLQVPALAAALHSCLATWEDVAAWYARLGAPAAPAAAVPQDPWSAWEEADSMGDDGSTDHEEDSGSDAGSGERDLEQSNPQDTLAADSAAACDGAASSLAASAAGEDDDAVAAEEPAPQLVWQPRQVVQVTHGAPQLQQLLEDLAEAWPTGGSQPGPWVLVEWYAPWATACQAASTQLAALAAAQPGLVCVSVDVSASPANEQLAFEKVMERAQAWRKGGRIFKHVLKSGEKWPAASLLLAPSLLPLQGFEGAGAAAALAEALQGTDTSGWLSDAAGQVPAQQQQQAAASGVAGSAVPASAQDQQQQSQGEGSTAGVPVQLPAAKVVTRGAQDLKAALAAAGRRPVLLAWCAGAAEPLAPAATAPAAAAAPPHAAAVLHAVAAAAVTAAGGLRLGGWLLADPAATAANQQLAAALRVKAAPVMQVYASNRVVASVRVTGQEHGAPVQELAAALSSAAAAGGAQAALAAAAPAGGAQAAAAAPAAGGAQGAAVGPQGSGVAPQANAACAGATSTTFGRGSGELNAASSSSSGGDSMGSSSGGVKGHASSAAAAAAPVGNSQGSSSSSQRGGGAAGAAGAASQWDPPKGKVAKPGVKKRLGPSQRVAVYWPRMPCLDCGCPWWSGEDWEAVCARCGWSCEEDGYDDDSNPLPAFQEKWEAIQAVIAGGKTPAWSGGK